MLIKLGCVRKLSNIKSNESNIGEKKKSVSLKNKKKDLPVDGSKMGVK